MANQYASWGGTPTNSSQQPYSQLMNQMLAPSGNGMSGTSNGELVQVSSQQWPSQNGFETIHQSFQNSPSMSTPEPQWGGNTDYSGLMNQFLAPKNNGMSGTSNGELVQVSSPQWAQQTGGAEPLQKSNQSTPLLGLAGGASYGGQQSTNLAPMSGGASFGGVGTSGGGSSSSTFQQNPYLRDQMAALTGAYQQSFLQNTAPQLRASAMASGQYGGSRQGIAEGIAQGNAATGLASALGQLQAGTYNTDSNTWLQNKGLDNSFALGMGNLGLGYTNAQNNYNLGMGNLGLGYTNAQNNYNLGLGSQALQNQGQNQQFFTNQRNTDLEQYRIGSQMANNGVEGQKSIGNSQYQTGNVYQQAPLESINRYSQTLQPYTGLNSSSTTTGNSGGGWTGAAGGATAANYVYNRATGGGSPNYNTQRINPNTGEYIGSLEF